MIIEVETTAVFGPKNMRGGDYMWKRFDNTAAAEEIMKDIKAGNYSSAVAYGLLNQIVNDLPGTAVAREAQRFLDANY